MSSSPRRSPRLAANASPSKTAPSSGGVQKRRTPKNQAKEKKEASPTKPHTLPRTPPQTPPRAATKTPPRTPDTAPEPPKVRGLDLEDMTRTDLRRICKTLGIKSNKKTTELVKELKQRKNDGVLVKMNIAMRQSEGRDYWDDPKPRPLRKIVITPPHSPVKAKASPAKNLPVKARG